MTYQRLLPFNGWAAIVSAAARLLAAALILTAILLGGIPELAIVVLLLVADIFLVFALLGVFGCQIEELGAYGFLGFVLAEIGVMVSLANFFPPSGRVIFLAGLLLIALMNQRSSVLPAGAMWSWFAGALIAAAAASTGYALLAVSGMLLAGSGLLWTGLHLLQAFRPPPDQPEG